MGLVDAKNTTPDRQRYFQQRYRKHVRVFQIGPSYKFIMPFYLTALYGGAACSLYCMGRMVLGHKTWFGKD